MASGPRTVLCNNRLRARRYFVFVFLVTANGPTFTAIVQKLPGTWQ